MAEPQLRFEPQQETRRHLRVRKRAVVYVGLDALSDAEVAAAVGNSMFADLVSVAGHIYKFGIDDGLPEALAAARVPINVHADEFNELMGDEFVPLVNKGGGAGLQVTAYTQTLSDIEARLGNRAKAGQVIGNFNNLFMLRVRETATEVPAIAMTAPAAHVATPRRRNDLAAHAPSGGGEPRLRRASIARTERTPHAIPEELPA